MDSIIRRLKLQWDRASAIGAAIAGLVTITLGWYGMSGTGFPSEQLPYIVSGGMLGLFLVGVAGTLWLSADLRDEWRKLDRIETHMEHLSAQLDEQSEMSMVSEPAAPVAANGQARKARAPRSKKTV